MKLSSVITAIFICFIIFILIMKRDLLTGGAEADLKRATAKYSKAQQKQNDAQIATILANEELVIAAVALKTAETALSPNASPLKDDVKTISVLAIKSNVQDLVNGIVLRGETKAFKFVKVKAETSGSVISQPRRKGALIQKGELLCQLDPGTKLATLAEANARLKEAERNLKNSKSLVRKGIVSKAKVINDTAIFESAQANLIRAKKSISNLEIRAPFSGLLETDSAEFGDLMQRGSLCATVIALDPIKLVGYATEQQVAKILNGASAKGRLLSGEELNGKVTFVAHSADAITRTFMIEISVDNPNLKIRDGSTADILISLPNSKGHFLPQSALTLDDDGYLGVRINQNNIAQFIPVVIVRDTIDGIWVTGLPDSVDVIIVGHEYVIDGTKITVSYKDTDK